MRSSQLARRPTAAQLWRDFGQPGEFLEGLDLPAEEDFEDWLREHRNRLAETVTNACAEPVALPSIDHGGHAEPRSEWHFPAQGPSVAVLRFANLTGDPGEAYLAEGFRQELINRLSRLRWLSVIAGDPATVQEKSTSRHDPRALGAKYLLDGTLRSAGTRSRGCLRANLTDLLWRGRWHLNQLQRADSDIAQQLFAKALAIDPHSSEALISVTHALAWAIWDKRSGSIFRRGICCRCPATCSRQRRLASRQPCAARE